MSFEKIKDFFKKISEIEFDTGINYYVIRRLLERLKKENEEKPNDQTKKEIKELEKVIELILTDG